MGKFIFSSHARKQMAERGASKKEIIEAVSNGEEVPAKYNRIAYRQNFQYNAKWGGKFYRIKQVMPIVKKDKSKIIVITVYTFYF